MQDPVSRERQFVTCHKSTHTWTRCEWIVQLWWYESLAHEKWFVNAVLIARILLTSKQARWPSSHNHGALLFLCATANTPACRINNTAWSAGPVELIRVTTKANGCARQCIHGCRGCAPSVGEVVLQGLPRHLYGSARATCWGPRHLPYSLSLLILSLLLISFLLLLSLLLCIIVFIITIIIFSIIIVNINIITINIIIINSGILNIIFITIIPPPLYVNSEYTRAWRDAFMQALEAKLTFKSQSMVKSALGTGVNWIKPKICPSRVVGSQPFVLMESYGHIQTSGKKGMDPNWNPSMHVQWGRHGVLRSWSWDATSGRRRKTYRAILLKRVTHAYLREQSLYWGAVAFVRCVMYHEIKSFPPYDGRLGSIVNAFDCGSLSAYTSIPQSLNMFEATTPNEGGLLDTVIMGWKPV